jgi:hypothetical protein
MKKFKLFLPAVVLAILFFSSCEKDDAPDYVGTWVTTESMDMGESSLEFKETLTLKEGSFNSLIQMGAEGQYVDFMGVKGSLDVSGQSVTMTITSVGMVDMTDPNASGLTWYEEGTDDFDSMIKESMEMDSNSMTGEYAVDGNKLTLKSDVNGDGTYSDDEITVYTKK